MRGNTTVALTCIAALMLLAPTSSYAKTPASSSPLNPPAPPIPAKPPAATNGAIGTPLGETKPEAWTDAEIREAIRQCDAVLATVAADVKRLPPIRDGVCGDPAPVLLKSIRLGGGANASGNARPVTFAPAPVVSCRMIAPLQRWLETGVQPAAERHLDSRVISVSTMSSYTCRTRYGREGARMSEHAFANALDIGTFELANAKRVSVLKHWGPTQRDATENPMVADAPVKVPVTSGTSRTGTSTAGTTDRRPLPLPQQWQHSVRVTPLGQQRSNARPAEAPLPLLSRASRLTVSPDREPAVGAEALDSPARTVGAAPPLPVRRPLKRAAASQAPTGGTIRVRRITTPPYRLGGPEPRDQALSAFLKDVHTSACSIFGTTLGPEANEAHRNHFHIDMLPRRGRGYCQ